MKVIHRVRCMLSKEVEVPDDLWNRFQHPTSDEEMDKACDEFNDYMSIHGVQVGDEVEEVEDEWYDEIKVMSVDEKERRQ